MTNRKQVIRKAVIEIKRKQGRPKGSVNPNSARQIKLSQQLAMAEPPKRGRKPQPEVADNKLLLKLYKIADIIYSIIK